MNTPMAEKPITLRIAEIVAELAAQKRDYFVNGIEKPMSVRADLEAQLAALRLQKLQINGLEKARAIQVRQRRGELVKARLMALGLPNVHDECHTQAENEIPPINTEGNTHA